MVALVPGAAHLSSGHGRRRTMVDTGQAFQAAGQGAPIAKETTASSFAADVITASARLPVLVDFWSATSPTSQQLSAALEKMVKATDGKVKLVRMDIDKHPQIASRLGVRNAPALFAFQRGQPVDGF